MCEVTSADSVLVLMYRPKIQGSLVEQVDSLHVRQVQHHQLRWYVYCCEGTSAEVSINQSNSVIIKPDKRLKWLYMKHRVFAKLGSRVRGLQY